MLLRRIKANVRTELLINGAALVVCGWIIATIISHFHPLDLNVYLAGAKVERISTFDDQSTIQALLAHAGAARNPAITPYPYGSVSLIALVFYPLSHLSFNMAFLVYVCATVALLAIGCQCISRKHALVILAALLCTYPIVFEMELGNWQPITTALVVIAICSLRDKKSIRAGFLIGLAGSFKLFPLFLVVPLVLKKDYRAFITTIATFIVTWIASLLILGPKDFLHGVVVSIFPSDHHLHLQTNVGIPGSVQYLTNSHWTAIVAFLVCIGASIALMWKFKTRDSFVLAIGATLLMFLASPVMWQHSTSLIFVALCLMLSFKAVRSSKMWWAIVPIALIQWIPFALLGPLKFFDFWAKAQSTMRWSPLPLTVLALDVWTRRMPNHSGDDIPATSIAPQLVEI